MSSGDSIPATRIARASPPETWQLIYHILSSHFPDRNPSLLESVFNQVQNLFVGNYAGYQACDTAFHDLAHTCHATAAMVRILDGHIKSGAPPQLTARDFELAVAGILLHDSGYFKEIGDNDGTGAKYTFTHVKRSADFAAKFLSLFSFTTDEIHTVQLAIQCTGINVDIAKLQFRDNRDRFLGNALGTGDILGQMAAPDYPERLPHLYLEFAEAAAYAHVRHSGVASYTSAEDLMRKTRGFYEKFVLQILDTQWGGVHKALNHHFPDGKNHYFSAIETNLNHIDFLLAEHQS